MSPEDYWTFRPGQRVMTIDGFPGTVASVDDGPLSGTETYIVTLANEMGGGEYTASQLRATSDATGSVHRTAADDYPELGSILIDRPDIARNTVLGAKSATMDALDYRDRVPAAPTGYVDCPVTGCNHLIDTRQMSLADHLAADHGEADLDTTAATNTVHASNPHGIEVFEGQEPNDGAESGVDEHGHLTWDGSSPGCRDSDEYSMFGQNDAVEKHSALLPQDHGEHGPFNLHGQCEKCGYTPETEDDQECDHPYCQETGFADGWHTKGEHIDPAHLDPGHADYQDAEKAVDDAFGTDNHGWLLDHQPQGPSRYSALQTQAAWSQTRHDQPVVHVMGQRPVRPLMTGDTVMHPESGFTDTVTAHTPTLLMLNQSGVMHRGPVEGDHSNTIWSSDTYDQAGQDVPHASEQAKQFLDSNPTGPSKYSSFNPWSILTTAATDPDFGFHVTASWADVRSKAKRIRAEGGVHLTMASDGMIVGEVRGDHHVYESGLQRLPGRTAIQTWSCGCKWGAYHWGAADDFSRFAGRMCSHALALQYEAQSRGMFGRSVEPDDSKPKWVPRTVVVKYDIDADRNRRAPATMPSVLPKAASLSPAALLIRHAMDHGEDLGEVTLALYASGIGLPTVQAAVNDAWGEPEPAPVNYAPGPTHPRDPNENPASAGFASAPDSDTWSGQGPSGGGGNRVMSALDDDAMFEPEMPKEAFLPLLLEALPAIAEIAGGAGAAGAGAGAGAAAGEAAGAGLAKTVAPKVMKALPGLVHGGEGGSKENPNTPQQSAPSPSRPAGPSGPDASNPLNYGAQADLHEEPEAALPRTDGDLEDDGDPFGAAGDISGTDSLEPESIGFASTGSVGDIVAQFQATATHLAGGGGGRGTDGADIAAAAREHLAKMALKDFTPAEQAQIINEGESVKAANLDRLDLTGTHYEPLEAALAAAEETEDDDAWMA